MYLTYEDYVNMGGTLDETAFNNFEYEAETIVNWYTFNRLKEETEYPEELARCMYRLIYLAKLEADALSLGRDLEGSGGSSSDGISTYVKSQSNDGVSISYNSVDASELFRKLSSSGADSPLAQTVFRYLQGVRNSLGKRLTYRGLYPDE